MEPISSTGRRESVLNVRNVVSKPRLPYPDEDPPESPLDGPLVPKERLMTVWIASVGEYDDYRVVGVCSTAERATEVAKAYDRRYGDPNEPEELEIDGECEERNE